MTSFHNTCKIVEDETGAGYCLCLHHLVPVYRDGIDWLEVRE